MEAVGLAASILTLVAGASYIQQKLNDYRKGAEERQQLLQGITFLKSVLDDLRTSYLTRQAQGFEEEWSDIVKPLQTSGCFQRIEDLFSELRAKLEPKHTLNRIVAQVSWPFAKEDVDRNIRQMRDLSADVSLVLQDVSLKLAIVTHDRVTKLDARDSQREQAAILDWLSSNKFIQQQAIEVEQATPGTCDWFLLSDKYQAWKYQHARILFCKAIGGAGKTILASKAYDDLRRFTAGQCSAIFIVYCKYDQPDTQEPAKIVASLLRQSIQLMGGELDTEMRDFLKDYYYRETAKPSLKIYLEKLNNKLNKFSSVYIIIDGLDEIKSQTSRKAIIDCVANLKNRPYLMFTSRPVDDIDNLFSDTSSTIVVQEESTRTSVSSFTSCAECGQQLSMMHYACEACHSELCTSCADAGSDCIKDSSAHITEFKLFAIKFDVSARPKAIRTYVRVRIEESKHIRKWIQRRPGLQREIEDKVVMATAKMFLLARLHMDSVTDPDLLKESDFDNALQTLPKELDESYDQAMNRVDRYGRSLLQLITFAERPLSAAEIEHVLGVDITNKVLKDGDIIPASALVSRCAGLVTFDAKGYVNLAHYTIAGYLWNHWEQFFANGHVELAHRCVAYLNLEAFSRGAELSKEEGQAYGIRLAQYPFLDYAAVYWAKHALQSHDESILPQGLALLQNESYFSSLVQALWYSKDANAAHWRKRKGASPLEMAIFLRSQWLFDALLKNGMLSLGSNKLEMTPLMLTAQAGEIQMTQQVLQMSSPINALNAENESALHLAMVNNHEDIALLLLDQPGIDVNLLTGRGPRLRTPLILAIVMDQIRVFHRLLTFPDIDIDINVNDGNHVLHFVIYNENDEALRALIKHGSLKLDREDSNGHFPLHIAAQIGTLPIVRTLLDFGADVNALDGSHGTALMRAADYGNVIVMKELLQHGIDWTVKDVFNRHALHSAAINGRADAAACILEDTEIDINLQDVHGNTALHDAAKFVDPGTVEVLLKHNARTDLINGRGLTPLDIARRVHGATHTVQSLAQTTEITHQENRADSLLMAAEYSDTATIESLIPINSIDGKESLEETDPWLNRTALHHVINRGFIELVPKLHQIGADLDKQDKYGRSPLHVAALMGRTEIAKYLLLHGAICDQPDSWGVTPLEAALQQDNRWTAVLLVEFDHPISKDTDIQWLLNLAAWQGNMKAAQRLIEAGARLDQKSTTGMSPYEYAKEQGHEALASFLDQAGREAPLVTFENGVAIEKKIQVQHSRAPDRKITEKGEIKTLTRTGTDDVRNELEELAQSESAKNKRTEFVKAVQLGLGDWHLIGYLVLLVLLIIVWCYK